MVIQSMIEKHFGKGFERRDNAGAHASTGEDSSDGDDKKMSTHKFLDVTP